MVIKPLKKNTIRFKFLKNIQLSIKKKLINKIKLSKNYKPAHLKKILTTVLKVTASIKNKNKSKSKRVIKKKPA
jgi:hypothetical protein